MSDTDTHDQVVTKTRKKLKPPTGYKVLLHNDNYTTMEFVVYVLESIFNKLNGLDSLVINALRFEPHPSHLNVDEAIEIINLINPKKTYSTHISHNMGFHEEVCKKLPKNVNVEISAIAMCK